MHFELDSLSKLKDGQVVKITVWNSLNMEGSMSPSLVTTYCSRSCLYPGWWNFNSTSTLFQNIKNIWAFRSTAASTTTTEVLRAEKTDTKTTLVGENQESADNKEASQEEASEEETESLDTSCTYSQSDITGNTVLLQSAWRVFIWLELDLVFFLNVKCQMSYVLRIDKKRSHPYDNT